MLDHDPTVDRLERQVADLLDREAGLWTPTGCMANLIALMLAPAAAATGSWPRPGPTCSARNWAPAPGWRGAPPRPWPGTAARAGSPPCRCTGRRRPQGTYYAMRTALLCLENTHAAAGGTCTPARRPPGAGGAGPVQGPEGAPGRGPAVERRRPPWASPRRPWPWGADTVAVCLSKGLGAPMGSVLCADRDTVARARRARKMLGGGLCARPGVVAAAGLVGPGLPVRGWARTTPRPGAWLRACAAWASPRRCRRPTSCSCPCPNAAAAALDPGGGPGAGPAHGGCLRFVTHRDLDEADVAEAVERIRPMADRLVTTWGGRPADGLVLLGRPNSGLVEPREQDRVGGPGTRNWGYGGHPSASAA